MPQKPFATRMQGASSNAIREILKLTQNPEVISFAGGMPAPSSFPQAFIRQAADKLLAEQGAQILQYGTSEGYTPLREEIIQLIKEKGIDACTQDVLIFSGSQQGIDLVAKTFLDPGDGVIVEEPTYLAAIQIFRSYQAQLIPVSGDSQGMDPQLLEKALQTHNVKLLYLVPTFQNPTGLTYSKQRRQEVVQLARQYGVQIIEDDPYGDLRYTGDKLSAIKALDQEDMVIYLGSFSKIISPGLRVGYGVITNPDVRQKVIIGKQGTDVHTSNLSQYIVHQFLASGKLASHIENICAEYKLKRDGMLAALQEFFPPTAQWISPEGGLFIWVELPAEISATQVLKAAVQQKVAFVPGAPFFPLGGGENTLRLNFSNASLENISVGCQRLGQVLGQNSK